MKIPPRTFPLFIVAALLLCLATPAIGGAEDEIYTNWRGLAIKGYDPVAFFQQGTNRSLVTRYRCARCGQIKVRAH